MLHSDVDDVLINCGGELTDAAQEKDFDGRPLLFPSCSRCGMEFAFCLDSDTVVMLMLGPIH
jgi:hypothetical protein